MCYDGEKRDALDFAESLECLSADSGCYWVKQEVQDEKTTRSPGTSGPAQRIELSFQ